MTDKKHTNNSWLKSININSIYSIDKQRRAFSLFTMAAFAILVISTLVITNFEIYAPSLTVMLILSDITIIGCLYYYFRTGKLMIATITVLTIIFFLCISLIYTGGKENTALYWLMFYPVVTYVTLGFKAGSILVSLMYICAIYLLYGPDVGQAEYDSVEKSRFVASFSMVIIFSFISEFFRYKSHQKIADMTLIEKQDALTDPLTGLANRRYIIDHIVPRLQQSSSELPLCILLIDLDNFKVLNDSYGHDFGDKVLISFTNMLFLQLRTSDIKARYGGEEFLVLLPKSNAEQASIVANKLRDYVANNPVAYDIGVSVPISCSIGVAQVDHASQFHKAIKQADDYLYQAKAAGRNKVISVLNTRKT